MKTFFFQNEFDLKLTFNGISKELHYNILQDVN